MPECHRCGRVQPTGELRRTRLGHVCKEGGETGKFSRCFKLAAERKSIDDRRARVAAPRRAGKAAREDLSGFAPAAPSPARNSGTR